MFPETDFYIDFPDFGCTLAASVTDFEFARDLGTVTVRANFDNDAIVSVLLSGTLTDGFRIDSLSMAIEPLRPSPRAVFTNSTLYPLLGLSRMTRLRIPEVALDLWGSFDLSLEKASRHLQMRQAACLQAYGHERTRRDRDNLEQLIEPCEVLAFTGKAARIAAYVFPRLS